MSAPAQSCDAYSVALISEQETIMNRITRLAVLLTGLMSLLGIASATAGAVTWHNSGSTVFTATAGASTLSSTSTGLNCTGATATGTAPAGSIGPTYSVSGTATFTGCVLLGILTGVDCGYTLTGTTQSGSVTSGAVDVTCGVYQFGTKICHIGGSASGTYTNPVSGVGVLSLATGGNLILSNGTSGTCPLGNGDRGHLSALTFRTTSAVPPVITRTA
jgi:hypothetical protein